MHKIGSLIFIPSEFAIIFAQLHTPVIDFPLIGCCVLALPPRPLTKDIYVTAILLHPVIHYCPIHIATNSGNFEGDSLGL